MQQLNVDPSSPSPAHKFELYGWKPDPQLTEDELYLDVVFLITRSTQACGRQGHMGALIVRQEKNSWSSDSVSIGSNVCIECPRRSGSNIDMIQRKDGIDNFEKRFWSNILGAATNTALFNTLDCTSDIHAEINALAEACKSSQSTENCTAYITIPPCKRCFAALVTFGVKRIVTRQAAPSIICETSAMRGIEVKHLSIAEKRQQMQRINKLINPERSDQELMEIAESVKQKRKERKKKAMQKSQKIATPTLLLSLVLSIIFMVSDDFNHIVHAQQQQHESIYAKYQKEDQQASFKYTPFDIGDSSIPVRVSLSGLGVIQGVRSHNMGVDFFGGIPFAAPPVGNRRWAPPQEPPKWSPQILDASEYGTDCYQVVDAIVNPLANPDTMSEDCLYLNIFTPAGAAAASAASDPSSASTQLLPVMVWLHGGGFQQGGAARPEYNARRLAQEERVVVVTVNYRLGALGFLVSSELGLYGNYGLQDQRAALHFIKRRIGSFGGDPNSITLFGESAGAVMIGLHLQMQNDGLFHKAILQSNPMGYQFRSVVVADFLGDALRRAVDCRDLECMRTEAVEEIIRAQSSLMGIPRSVGDFFAWGPTLTTATATTTGTSSLSYSTQREWEHGRSLFSVDQSSSSVSRFNHRRESTSKFMVNVTQPLHNLHLVPDHIPIIIGTNKHEGEMFVHSAFPLTMSKAVYWMFVGALFKDSAPRVLKHYRTYVAQLEADAAALAEKQVSEEQNKQYWAENQATLEEEYQELLKTTTTTRGGGFDNRNHTSPDDGMKWWQRMFASEDPVKAESRRQRRLANLKQKAKEKALKGASKVSVDYRPVMSRIINDYLFRCPSWHYAHLLSLQRVNKNVSQDANRKQRNRNGNNEDKRNNVYVYRFSQPTHVPGYKECWGKSCHTAELPYVFEAIDIIRSDYSTLSRVAEEEAPSPPEFPYTDLLSAYKDDLNNETVRTTSSSTSSSQLSNYTSYFQGILRHFFDDYFLEDSDEETAHDMARRWVAFARTGNPNHDESSVEWIPWRFIPHFNNPEGKSHDDYLPWESDRRKLFNIWRDVEDKVLEDSEGTMEFSQEGEELALSVEAAFRKRALEVLNMEVVEEDSLRTELTRNKPSSSNANGDNPLGALRQYLSRWNNTIDTVTGENSAMIEQIQRMAQDMGVLGTGLSGGYNRLLGGGFGGINSGNSGGSSHGYWEDDFFPQFLELQWPPEGRLVERDCTCDFWERIRYRY